MKNLLLLFVQFLFCLSAIGQDKIYKKKIVIEGKVVEVAPKSIKFVSAQNLDGPAYVMETRDIDSIVYANGQVDVLAQVFRKFKRDPTLNIPFKNTLATDIMGYVFFSVSNWYERRVWNDRVGIRIPLNLCYGINSSPGNGIVFLGRTIVLQQIGFAFSTGINPKFYVNKHRHVRFFAGPEITIGYSQLKRNQSSYTAEDYNNFRTKYKREAGNLASLAIVGLCFNINDKANITLDGGAGYNVWWGNFTKYNTVAWRVGLSFGGNF